MSSNEEEEVEVKVVITDEKSQDNAVDKEDEAPQTFPQRVSSEAKDCSIHSVSLFQ